MESIAIFIPVYHPDDKLKKLLNSLLQQTVLPEKIYLLHTIEEPESRLEEYYKNLPEKDRIEEIPIAKKDFDHGGTRAYGASLSKADFLMFMTQDAVPSGKYLIQELLVPFAEPKIAACYARQLPRKEAGTVEKLIRKFNYPDEDRIQSAEDVERLGIKAYFCSDVCAIYRRNVYEEMGGFVKKTIFNEDMIMAADMIQAGYKVAYAASARVIHSHQYTWKQQFTRNFDLGVSQVEYSRVFAGISSESEGMSMVKYIIRYLFTHGQALQIPWFIGDCGAKFIGYRMGKMYKRLPRRLVVACSMNKGYWES